MRLWLAAAGIAIAALAAGQPVEKIYPGARLDAAGTEQARSLSSAQAGVDVTVCTTVDPYYKVLAYFEKRGREFKPVGTRARKLPNGKLLHDAFFILDSAPTIASSKRWVKLQYPYIGQYGLSRDKAGQYDIRDVTAIMFSEKK